jgi:hypothetical protein
MATLPARPDLDQLRRQSKDLLRAARSGDATAADRMLAVSGRLTLTAARLVIARDHGFASWARLREEVPARIAALPEVVRAFCEASIADWTGKAVRILAARPELAEAGLAPAVVLGGRLGAGDPRPGSGGGDPTRPHVRVDAAARRMRLAVRRSP